MNQIVKNLREQAFELLQNQPTSKLANLLEFAALSIENKITHIDNLTLTRGEDEKLIAALQVEVARLTAGSEAMQIDAENNAITIKMLMAQLAEQVEENRGLRQMLHMEPR